MSDGESSVADRGDPSLGVSGRFRLDIAYDGTGFSGWAVQPDRRTVQGVLAESLARVLRVPAVELTVAGRTDAGVHARGQVAHAELPASVDGPLLARRLARLLPPDVRVTAITPAPPGFDARFSAMWRRYEYRICDSPVGADPLRRGFVLAWPRPLAEPALRAAAAGLVGEHDFAAYCRAREGATTIREVQTLDVHHDGAEIVVRVQADAFCHSMVRSLVGALLAVGEGRRPPEWPAALLRRDRRADDVTVAAAHGLTLVAVGYPPDDQLAERARVTRAVRQPRSA